MKIEIKNRWTNEVIFTHECEDNTISITVSEAIKSGANLRGADLTPIKNDLFVVLLTAIPEIPRLKKSIIEVKIDGSTYSGACACLCGTLEKSSNETIIKAVFDRRDSGRPIERFFLGIEPGNTPENNQAAALVMEWIEEFEGYVSPVTITTDDPVH